MSWIIQRGALLCLRGTGGRAAGCSCEFNVAGISSTALLSGRGFSCLPKMNTQKTTEHPG